MSTSGPLCPSCSTENVACARFCEGCGDELEVSASAPLGQARPLAIDTARDAWGTADAHADAGWKQPSYDTFLTAAPPSSPPDEFASSPPARTALIPALLALGFHVAVLVGLFWGCSWIFSMNKTWGIVASAVADLLVAVVWIATIVWFGRHATWRWALASAVFWGVTIVCYIYRERRGTLKYDDRSMPLPFPLMRTIGSMAILALLVLAAGFGVRNTTGSLGDSSRLISSLSPDPSTIDQTSGNGSGSIPAASTAPVFPSTAVNPDTLEKLLLSAPFSVKTSGFTESTVAPANPRGTGADAAVEVSGDAGYLIYLMYDTPAEALAHAWTGSQSRVTSHAFPEAHPTVFRDGSDFGCEIVVWNVVIFAGTDTDGLKTIGYIGTVSDGNIASLTFAEAGVTHLLSLWPDDSSPGSGTVL